MVFHHYYRYSCLHFLFQTIHTYLAAVLLLIWNALLPLVLRQILSFGDVFDARVFSAQSHSTSELLRTL